MRITSCKIDHIINPLGFHLTVPCASWTVEDTTGKRQAWARVRVAVDEQMTEIVYDTSESADLSSLACPLPFDLSPRTRYYWTVQVMADNGETAISEINWFETAKLDEPWQAKWITPGTLDCQNPVFEAVLTLPEAVTSARIYAIGLGVYELYLNGKRIGNEYLAPGCNNYQSWLQYQTYEVALLPCENRLTASLGNGWYKGEFNYTRKPNQYGDQFKLLLELRAVLTDGTPLVFGTNGEWTVRKGEIVSNNIYDGEVVDPSAAGAAPHPVTVLEDGYDLLTARRSLPVVVKQQLVPQKVIQTPAGETVLDFGQNFAGFVRFRCHLPKGNTIRLQYGEVLQDGNFYRDNLRSAKAEYVYHSDGTKRFLEPHFTYYGFRYVKVEGIRGPLDPGDFIGCVLYSDLDDAGVLTTGNDKVNRLIENTIWGQRSNYIDVPTDCPQRDERLGWTGDAQVFAATACYNMDSYGFLRKYCYDLYTVQRLLGHVTNVIPPFNETGPSCAAWGDAATILPWTLYRYYGDRTILGQQYDSMVQWVESIRRYDDETGSQRLWKAEFAFGDWLAMDHEDPDERMQGGTDTDFVSTAYYYYSVTLVAKAAAVLGKEADKAKYESLAQEIKQAFLSEFFTSSGRLAISTQTGYTLALFLDLLPPHSREKLAEALAVKLKHSHGYLKTGFVGTAYLPKVLSENGYNDLAYGLLLNEESPSWLYAVNLGATTIWERWNSMLPDGRVNGTDMNSFNHYSYGSVVEWMYQYMAGIRPCDEAPGFKKVVIAPMPDQRIPSIDAIYPSAAGRYEVHWKYTDNAALSVKIVIPFDAEAVVTLPFSGKEPFTLGAGTYEYLYAIDNGMEQGYTLDSSLASLMADPAAVAFLDSYFPGWQGFPPNLTTNTIRQIAATPFFHFTDAELAEMERQLGTL